MVDRLTPERRSWLMSRVISKNTTPELAVRKMVHGLGFRFRLHPSDLAGKPDIVLPKWRSVIFVHGCFWHRHKGCKKATSPKSRVSFWKEKFARNVARDAAVRRKLNRDGWRVLTVWQCELADEPRLLARLKRFLVHSKSS
jgi:DNA mismatch endonuclease (patch repair protein)